MDQNATTFQITARLSGDLAERTQSAATKLFHGNEAMLAREALTVYLDLRDALGFDFDRVVQPLRERESVAAS